MSVDANQEVDDAMQRHVLIALFRWLCYCTLFFKCQRFSLPNICVIKSPRT
jgi:hypothetical protein